MENKIVIRPYTSMDRNVLRNISYQTAFLERADEFVDDPEILKDALTIYFTDYEPESCFVACDQDEVVGYVIGTKSVSKMNYTFTFKILPQLSWKAFRRGLFFKRKQATLFFYGLISFLRGEFFVPVSIKKYPALLHINVDKKYRGKHIGEQLIDQFIIFLKNHDIQGVHLSTFSDHAKKFFIKKGFTVIFESKRTYLDFGLRKVICVYTMAKSF